MFLYAVASRYWRCRNTDSSFSNATRTADGDDALLDVLLQLHQRLLALGHNDDGQVGAELQHGSHQNAVFVARRRAHAEVVNQPSVAHAE